MGGGLGKSWEMASIWLKYTVGNSQSTNKNEINKSGPQLLLLLACYPAAGSVCDLHDSVISPEGEINNRVAA